MMQFFSQHQRNKGKYFDIGEFTCCRSSLSDFSWATMALMQPFMEHSVA